MRRQRRRCLERGDGDDRHHSGRGDGSVGNVQRWRWHYRRVRTGRGELHDCWRRRRRHRHGHVLRRQSGPRHRGERAVQRHDLGQSVRSRRGPDQRHDLGDDNAGNTATGTGDTSTKDINEAPTLANSRRQRNRRWISSLRRPTAPGRRSATTTAQPAANFGSRTIRHPPLRETSRSGSAIMTAETVQPRRYPLAGLRPQRRDVGHVDLRLSPANPHRSRLTICSSCGRRTTARASRRSGRSRSETALSSIPPIDNSRRTDGRRKFRRTPDDTVLRGRRCRWQRYPCR